jgi:putative ABC transport system permease protein
VSTRTVSGRWFRPDEDDAIVVNTRLVADDSSVAPGRVVPLLIDGKRRSVHVVGVAEIGLQPLAFMSRNALASQTRDTLVDEAVVTATMQGHALALAQRVQPALGDLAIDVTTTEIVDATRSAVEDHLVMVAAFLGVMSQLIIVIGGLGLAASMSIGVLERTREIGVLRAIGARELSILGLIQVEGLAIAVVSWIVSLPLSVPMSYILARVFGGIMLPTTPVYWPGLGGLARWMAVVVVVSFVSCMWPAWRAMRVSVRQALAYE